MEYQKAKKYEYFGAPQLSVALRCRAIGKAVLQDGREVYITWGRNLPKDQAEQAVKDSNFEPVRQEPGPPVFELILPDELVEDMLPCLVLG